MNVDRILLLCPPYESFQWTLQKQDPKIRDDEKVGIFPHIVAPPDAAISEQWPLSLSLLCSVICHQGFIYEAGESMEEIHTSQLWHK